MFITADCHQNVMVYGGNHQYPVSQKGGKMKSLAAGFWKLRFISALVIPGNIKQVFIPFE